MAAVPEEPGCFMLLNLNQFYSADIEYFLYYKENKTTENREDLG